MQTPVMWGDTSGPGRSARTRMRASWATAQGVRLSVKRSDSEAIGGRFTAQSWVRGGSAGGVPAVDHDRRAGEEGRPVAGHVDVEIGDLLRGRDAPDGMSGPEHGPEGLR